MWVNRALGVSDITLKTWGAGFKPLSVVTTVPPPHCAGDTTAAVELLPGITCPFEQQRVSNINEVETYVLVFVYSFTMQRMYGSEHSNIHTFLL